MVWLLLFSLLPQYEETMLTRATSRVVVVAALICWLAPHAVEAADSRGTYRVQRAPKRRADYLRVSRRGIQAAQKRIGAQIDLPTPLVHSKALSKRYGVDVYLKLESATAVGSFKIRGALNTVLSLPPSIRQRGVVAASTGNHAQGVAWAARHSGVEATIVMPEGASPLKAKKTRKLDAKVMLAGEDYGRSVRIAKRLAKDSGKTFISGYEDKRVIEGQGTIGREILQQLPDADWIISALGGGGLLGGISSAGHNIKGRPRYIGVQTENNAPMFEALRAKPGARPKTTQLKKTIADGTLVTKTPTPRMVDLLRSRIDMVVKVSESRTERAVLELLRTTGQRIEGAGSLPLAGLEKALKDLETAKDLQRIAKPKKVVLVLSGGNIDQEKLDAIEARYGNAR